MANLLEHTPFREGRHPTFTSSENGCTHVGKNNSREHVRQFQVDGGIIPKNAPDPRCDYLLLNDDKQTARYIELKGSDIEKAIAQIENTIRMLHPSISSYTIFRRIVYRTGSHSVNSRSVTTWKLKYGKNNGAVVSERKYEENI